MKENKSINLTDEVNKKSQKQNKNETNRNKNIIINRASTNIPNDSNENNLKDSINRMQKDNLKSNINCNNNFQKIYNNIRKYNNLYKASRRFFNSRDKILKDNSNFNKVKSKNEFISNNLKQKKKLYFNDNDEDKKNENSNIKKIIYKKNNNILKNNLNKKKTNKRESQLNYIKIEELNEILSLDSEDTNSKNLSNENVRIISDSSSELNEKEIISNTLTIKDELINYDSDNETNKEKNISKDSNNFNNELALILDKHLTQINFNRTNRDISFKKISSHSPPPKQTVIGKNSQMMTLNIDTINQAENPFKKKKSNNEKEIPINSAKTKKISKNIIRNSQKFIKEKKKELMFINYLKKKFFYKSKDNNCHEPNDKYLKNKNAIHRSKNDINNCEFYEEMNNNKKVNNNRIKFKKSNRDIFKNKEEFKINIDYDNDIENNKIKFKEYKLKNNSITNGIACFNDMKENHQNNLDSIYLDKYTPYLNYTLNYKNNNLIEKEFIKVFRNGNNPSSISFTRNKDQNKNVQSLENEKNYVRKKSSNLFRNNSQNNNVIKKESSPSIKSNLCPINENNKNFYQVNANNINKNKMKEKKEINDKIESIDITSNNKLSRKIPSPQHKNKEKNHLLKNQKNNKNSSKLNSSNNLINITINTTNNKINKANNNISNNTYNKSNYKESNNINDIERTKSNSNNFIDYMSNKNRNLEFTFKEKLTNDLVNEDIQNPNKFPSKKNIKCINKNINHQKYKNYKISQKKSATNDSSKKITNHYYNPNTSTTNNNYSGINLEENYKNNKSPKMSKNNINMNINNSANKFILLNKNKNKRNININKINYNNEEMTNNNSLNNYINNNSYSTADKNSFIHITNSNVTKMKKKIINNINQKGSNQNFLIHPKTLFPNLNNNAQNIISNNKHLINKQNNNISSNSINKINKSISNNNIINDVNMNNNYNNMSNNVNNAENGPKINICLYNKNGINGNKKLIDNMSVNNSPEIIKKSSTTMKNKNDNQNSNVNINTNNRNSINGNKLIFHQNNITSNIYNLKKNETKKICSKISNKAIKKNTNNGNNNHEDTLLDGQLPTVADENPNVNSLKIMKYNKCTYTNQIISQKLTKIFCIKKINESITQFLTREDLYNLSLVNNFYNEILSSIIYNIIVKKVMKNSENIRKNLWNEILKKSIFYQNNNSINDIYLTYLNISNKYDEEIKKDLSRTLPNNNTFKKESNNYKKLFNVLKAYSNFNKKIGYAQGMNFIVAKLLIFYKNERQSFLYLDALFNKLNFSKVIGITNGLEQKMSIIQFLLQKYSPKIIKFLEDKKINHEMFTAQWIITLFSKNFDNNKLLSIIWDFSIIFGWKFIYLFMISIIINFQDKCINLELYEFTQFMKKIFKNSEFENDFNFIIKKTFEFMKQWKKINKELEKNLEINKIKTDTESGTDIILDSFDEDTIIQ